VGRESAVAPLDAHFMQFACAADAAWPHRGPIGIREHECDDWANRDPCHGSLRHLGTAMPMPDLQEILQTRSDARSMRVSTGYSCSISSRVRATAKSLRWMTVSAVPGSRDCLVECGRLLEIGQM